MAIKSQIDAILQEKMDRKDFLKYAGTVLLGVIGVAGLLRILAGNRELAGSSKEQSSGYGSSTYGK